MVSGPAKDLVSGLQEANAEVRLPQDNLVSRVWSDRPAAREEVIHEHRIEFAGKSASDKLAELHKWNQAWQQITKTDKGVTYLISTLDEVAWILNLRSRTIIPCNPVFPAYVTVTTPADREAASTTTIYVSEALVPADSAVAKYLSDTGVQVRGHDAIWDALANDASVRDSSLVTSEKDSWAVVQAFAGGQDNLHVLGPQSPVAMAKAVKNEVELQGFRDSYLRDGIAWCIWVAQLDHDLRKRGRKVDEWTAAKRLDDARKPMKLYRGESYEPISATGEHAALPHYETSRENNSVIDINTPFLMDYGAQYADGTIDTTRTMWFGRGKPSKVYTRAFTRVLQGHIALASAVFPAGTTGATLDVLARKPLWHDGMNYSHGTGHGIGSYLNVHEGPQGFSTSSGGSKVPVALQPGMVLSDEPGFYEEGHFGIRTESLIGVKKVHTRREFGGVEWYGFEYFTQVPIDRKLVDESLLSAEEKQWLKDHNERVKAKILPHLKHEPLAYSWLKSQ